MVSAWEGLERRLLLTCTVVQELDTLWIKGTEGDDAVQVMDLGWGNVVVDCPDDSGQSKPQTFEGVARVVIETGGGNDTVNYDAASKERVEAAAVGDPFFDVFADVSMDLGAGADSLKIKFDGIDGDTQLDVSAGEGDDAVALLLPAVQKVREAAARVDLGGGNDQLQVEAFSLSDGMPFLKFPIEIIAGAGDDAVAASFFDVFTELAIDTGAGNDKAKIVFDHKLAGDPVAGVDQLDLSTGEGDDAVALLLPAVQKVREAAMRMDLGGGNDQLKIDATGDEAGTLKAFVNTGAGNDAVEGSFFDVFLDLDTDLGAGNDSATYKFHKLTVAADDPGTVPDVDMDIAAGEGNDSILIGLLLPAVQKAREAAVRVDLGAGNDSLHVDARSDAKGGPYHTIKLRLGAGLGNDRVDASFFDVFTDVGADMGGGNDRVLLKITRDSIVGDPTGLDDALDIRAGEGNDAVLIGLLLPAVQKIREAAARVDLGAGDDVAQINARGAGTGEGLAHIKLELKADKGNDRVGASFFDVFTDIGADLGAGNDSAAFTIKFGESRGAPSQEPGSANLDVAAGDGNDAILIGLLLPAVQKVREAAARVDLGSGNDLSQTDIIAGTGAGGGPHVKVFSGGGSGNDILGASFSNTLVDAELDGGTGNDKVSARALLPAIDGTLSSILVKGGDGNDTLGLLLSGGSAKAIVDGGAGRDNARVSRGVEVLNVEKYGVVQPPRPAGKR